MRCLISRYIGATINQVVQVVRPRIMAADRPASNEPTACVRASVPNEICRRRPQQPTQTGSQSQQKRNQNAVHERTPRPRSVLL